jgi:serine/threonine-protein kinase
MAEMSTIGKYEIRRELGRGAMGVVYEAYDPMIKRIVALKTIRVDQLVGENAESVIARFRREAQAAGRLNHPNIVAIYDIGEEAGTWYIAMEYIQGRELKSYFEANERFAPADIVRIMTQILDALGYSHKSGVIHRDIKPANVILLSGGGVKVADFGIAHIESSNMTQVGTVMGTPSYMSPEQIMGLPIDGRSDLFSAGVILYQFLTGERPFSGSSTVTMHKVLEEDPLPPSRFNVQVPGTMDAIVRRALAKRPDERYQSAEEFAEALQGALSAHLPPGAAEDTVIGTPTAAPLAASSKASPSASSTATSTNTQRIAPPETPGSTATPAPASAVDENVAAPAPSSQTTAIAIVAVLALVAIGAGAWMMMHRSTDDGAKVAKAPPPTATAAAPPTPAAAAPSPPPAPAPSAAKVDPGSVAVAAEGLVDPSDPRYNADKSLLQSDLRADAKGQLVAKALGLMVDPNSLAKNYAIVRDKLLAQSGNFVSTVTSETAPRMGKDGLMSMQTQGVVNVRALQKSLNQMSRDERVEFIRASGDPKISVRIAVRDADQPNAPPQPSPVAENLLKDRIKQFGFRTWSDDGPPDPKTTPDFIVLGEAQVKRLTMRLAASGVVVTKYALNSWTVKCIDRATGEEIYFNTTMPTAMGSWASEAEAMQAIGGKIADEFSRNFFLQHVSVSGRKVALVVEGMPNTADDVLLRELVSLPAVITATARQNGNPRIYDLQLAGSGAEGDLVAAGILKALNAKLGQPCFALGQIAAEQVNVTFDKSCTDASVVSRFDTNPPAGLYGAPPPRQKALIKNPETLKQLTM